MYCCDSKSGETQTVQNRTMATAVKHAMIEKIIAWTKPELELLECRMAQLATSYGPSAGVTAAGNGSRAEQLGFAFRRIAKMLVNRAVQEIGLRVHLTSPFSNFGSKINEFIPIPFWIGFVCFLSRKCSFSFSECIFTTMH